MVIVIQRNEFLHNLGGILQSTAFIFWNKNIIGFGDVTDPSGAWIFVLRCWTGLSNGSLKKSILVPIENVQEPIKEPCPVLKDPCSSFLGLLVYVVLLCFYAQSTPVFLAVCFAFVTKVLDFFVCFACFCCPSFPLLSFPFLSSLVLSKRLRAAEVEGIQVSTPAYNAALKAFAAGKALEPGLLFLKSMREEGRIPLDEQTHNIAIELCKECGDTAGAVAILEDMRGHGVSKGVRDVAARGRGRCRSVRPVVGQSTIVEPVRSCLDISGAK